MPGFAYYRANWEEMEYIGHAEWVPADLETEGDEPAP
jgi:hypothetical protein